MSRHSSLEHLSLHQFFHNQRNNDKTKQLILPNFVGLSGTPCYPVTSEYARHSLIVHSPWRIYPSHIDWISEFNQFINSSRAPISAKLTYQRVVQRYIDKMTHYEAKAHEVDHSSNPVSEEDQDIMYLAGLKGNDEFDSDDAIFLSLEKGCDFEWDKSPKVRLHLPLSKSTTKATTLTYFLYIQKRNLLNPNIEPSCWLKSKIEESEKEINMTLTLPLREDGSEYTVDELFKDQLDVITVVLETIYKFLNCENFSDFKPLRLLINGQAGSGKSVMINTLVTIKRKMFACNEVIRVIAPTGVAAYNVNGETFHHLFQMGVTGKEYQSNNMSQFTRKKLIQTFKMTLAIVIDERSLVTSRLLGTAEAMASETMHGGCFHQSESWGRLPILIMVGDDYQLPGIGEGAFTALYNRYASKMVYKGRQCLLECADFVMQLGISKRVTGQQAKTRSLLDRLRVGTDILEQDIAKLMSLHLDNV